MARKIEEGATSAPASPQTPDDGISMNDLNITDGVGPVDKPRLRDRPAALLMVHPERWGVMCGQVVPLAAKLPIMGGVANVRVVDPKRGTLSISQALAIQHKRGWQEIPLDVDGPRTSYLRRVLPGVYLTRWETAHAGSSVVTADGPGYVAWLRGLIEAGKIPRAPRYVLERLLEELRRSALELKDKVRTVPSAQVDLDRALEDIQAVERELGDQPLHPVPSAAVELGDIVQE